MIKFANSQDPTANEFTEFLYHHGIWIAVVVSVVIASLVVLFLILARRHKEKPYEKKDYEGEKIYEALGGKENILSHYRTGSRISLVLINYNKVDEKALNALGVDSIIKMSKKITLVVKSDAEAFYRLFE